MMNWWLDRGIDGFRMDVINVISKEWCRRARPARRHHRRRTACRRQRRRSATPGPTSSTARASTSSCRRCTGRSSPTGRPGCSPSARRRPPRSRTAGSTPTPRAASSTWSSSSSTSTSTPGRAAGGTSRRSSLVDLKETMERWQKGLAERRLEQPLLGQPRPAARGQPLRQRRPEHRVASAKALATVLHLHRGTPYIYQGDELGMTNGAFEPIEDFRDLESLNHYEAATGRGEDPDRRAGRAPAQGPRQRPDADAVGRDRARRLHHRDAVAARPTPTTRRSTPPPRSTTRTRCSPTTSG